MFNAKDLNEMSKEAPKLGQAVDGIMELLVDHAVSRAGFGFTDAELELNDANVAFKEYTAPIREKIIVSVLDELNQEGFDTKLTLFEHSPVSQVISYEDTQTGEYLLSGTDKIEISWKDR